MIELSNIKSPEDIRQLTIDECESLADDIRTNLLRLFASYFIKVIATYSLTSYICSSVMVGI